MSYLIAVAFDDPHRAEQVRLDLQQLQREDSTHLEEAVVVVRDAKGKIRLHHATHFTLPLALGGGFLGTLVGLVLINPLLAAVGGLTGSAVGAVFGALKEVGIDEDFIEALAVDLKPNTSALFILARRAKPETIVETLKPFKGRILQTSLAHEDEEKIQAALKEAEKSLSR